MKKMTCLFLTTLLVILSSCNYNRYQIDLLNEDDFTIQFAKERFSLGQDFETFETDSILKVFKPMNENKIYEIYVYDDFSFRVSPDMDGTNYIWWITLFTSKCSTFRDVKVGDSYDSLLYKYGEPSEITNFNSINQEKIISNRYDYEKNSIFFSVNEDNKIIEIVYTGVGF